MAERSRIYTEKLLIRMSPDDLERLDHLRGDTNRSEFVRLLIRAHTHRTASIPAPTAPMPSTQQPTLSVVRHLHKYVKGDHVGYHQGVKTYDYRCDCGAGKVE